MQFQSFARRLECRGRPPPPALGQPWRTACNLSAGTRTTRAYSRGRCRSRIWSSEGYLDPRICFVARSRPGLYFSNFFYEYVYRYVCIYIYININIYISLSLSLSLHCTLLFAPRAGSPQARAGLLHRLVVLGRTA